MKLSIITVSYNAGDSISRTLTSVRRNKTEDIEYIVIDGGSKDCTLDILNKNRDIIDILISEKDEGIYDALNKGIKISNGDYIMLLAADDELLDGALLNVFQSLKHNTDIWCGSIIQKNAYGYFMEISNPDLSELLYHCSLKNPASIFRREVFEKYGFYDTRWKCDGDRELFLRMYLNNVIFQVEMIPVVLFNEGGISSNNRLKYAIPEGIEISIQYGMKKEVAKKYYNKMIKREKMRILLSSNYITSKLLQFLKSRFIYSIFCKITKRENNKIPVNELKKYGVNYD